MFERQKRGIGLYLNSNKIDFMCFNQNSAISSLNSKSLKLIDQFINLGNYILSAESDVNIHIEKTWNATDMLSTM